LAENDSNNCKMGYGPFGVFGTTSLKILALLHASCESMVPIAPRAAQAGTSAAVGLRAPWLARFLAEPFLGSCEPFLFSPACEPFLFSPSCEPFLFSPPSSSGRIGLVAKRPARFFLPATPVASSG
jgi:hypothetical protein